MTEYTGIMHLLETGLVRRFHTEGRLLPQSVAEHSWGVAVLLLHFWPDSRSEVIREALGHDMGEYVSGDLPAPVKWNSTVIKEAHDKIADEFREKIFPSNELDNLEHARLKAMDYLELMHFLVKEKQSGRTPSHMAPLKKLGIMVIDRLNFADDDDDSVHLVQEEIRNLIKEGEGL